MQRIRHRTNASAGRRALWLAAALLCAGVLGAAVRPPQQWRAPLPASAPIGVYVAPGEGVPGFHEGDLQLARWALAAWERAAAGGFSLRDAPQERALLHLYWVSGADGLYGEMRPFLRGSERGAAVFVLPDTDALGAEIARRAGADTLFRDTVVYLTCLHELGHAFGLAHTAEFDDIMYSFRYGGDIPYYFQRYRDRLHTRADIEQVSGLSDNDVRRLRVLYPHP